MEKLRLDPITGRWLIITEEDNFISKISTRQAKTNPVDCPFCLGNESMTPPETDADRPEGGKPNSGGWLTRTVPNKFPALKVDSKTKAKKEGIFEKRPGIGFHEVIIETPEHNKYMSDLSGEEIERVVTVYQRRFLSLSADKRIKYILIFKNHGLAAGASLEHPHTQLIGLPIVPKRVIEELDRSQNYFLANKRCMFCDTREKEKTEEIRVITENSDFVAFCPFFSRSPFEITIVPSAHNSDFSQINARQIKSLSAILKEVLAKLKNILGNYPYNFLIHTSPINIDKDTSSFYHWHIEFLPKLGEIAGFEWATGGYINPVSPEEASQRLKKT